MNVYKEKEAYCEKETRLDDILVLSHISERRNLLILVKEFQNIRSETTI